MKGHSGFLTRLRQHQPRDFGISAIVAHELFYGAYRGQRTAENLARVDALQFEVLDFDRGRAPGGRAARAIGGSRHADRRLRRTDRRSGAGPCPYARHPQHRRVSARAGAPHRRLGVSRGATRRASPTPACAWTRAWLHGAPLRAASAFRIQLRGLGVALADPATRGQSGQGQTKRPAWLRTTWACLLVLPCQAGSSLVVRR